MCLYTGPTHSCTCACAHITCHLSVMSVRLLGCLSCTSVCLPTCTSVCALVCVCGCTSGCMSIWQRGCSLTLTLDHGPKCLHKGTQLRRARIGRLSWKGLQEIPDTLIILDWPKCSFGFFHYILWKTPNELIGQAIKACKSNQIPQGCRTTHPLEWVKGSGRVDR